MYQSPNNYNEYNRYPTIQNRSYNRSLQSFDNPAFQQTPPDQYHRSTYTEYRNYDNYRPISYNMMGPEPFRGPEPFKAHEPMRLEQENYRGKDLMRDPEYQVPPMRYAQETHYYPDRSFRFTPERSRSYKQQDMYTPDRSHYQAPPSISKYSRTSANYPTSKSYQNIDQNSYAQSSLLNPSVGGLVSDMEYLYFEGEGEFTKYRLQPRKFQQQ